MTDNELRKLTRQELLQMLIEQTRRADELQEKLKETEKKLEEKYLLMENAGSIAMAALRLNKVFEAADEAVAQYIDSVKAMGGNVAMPEIPKAASPQSLDKLLKDYSEPKRNAPAVQTGIPAQKGEEKHIEPPKLSGNAPVTKVREIKHLKNN